MKSIHVLVLVALTLGPIRARAEAAQPKGVSLKHLTCQEYENLPGDIRPMVAAWIHGFYYREGWKDAWMLDIDRARRTLAALDEACKETPQASFRYKLGEVLKKRRAAEGSR